ncbi:MAG: endonuclease/exonuclease/phosphatase family protein, partial [Candidatus Thiodiazotropha endolucinida]|nr:endonuclease/exonuclease/phosphatase family protein [Candidatus Thiodiazotropha taylori]MCW4263275.1 endonuclease/exonuclease/phosphatase family protein [Candidatus Thiodiazotropha endolucinida]
MSWHCLNCNAVNYHSVSSNFLEDLVLSNRFEPISPNENSSSHHTFHSDILSSPGEPVHRSSPVAPAAAKPTSSRKTPKCTIRTLKPLKVLNVNLNSIVAHSTDLCNMVDSIDPDIIVGVETKIDSSIHIGEILPKQFLENVVRVDRKRGGGGVIIAAKDDFICSEVPELQTQCEIAWMKIEIVGCKPLYVCGYYKPQEGDAVSLNGFEESLRRLGIVNSHILIAGDMNFPGYDWLNNCLKPNCNYPTLTYQFVDLLDDLSLTQLVNTPTRGNNVLDLVIANNPSLIAACRVIPGVSDHDAVLTEVNLKPIRNKQNPRKIPLYKKADWIGLRKHMLDFGQSLRENFDITTPVNQLWENITSELERAINKFIPHKTSKSKDKQPWINAKIRRLMRKRDKLFLKNRHQPSSERLKKYKSLKHHIQSLSRKAYWDYVEDLITPKDENSSQENFSISKKFYTFIKHKKTDATGLKTLKKDGVPVTDSEEKADMLNNHFQTVFSKHIPMKLCDLCNYLSNLFSEQDTDMP